MDFKPKCERQKIKCAEFRPEVLRLRSSDQKGQWIDIKDICDTSSVLAYALAFSV